MKDNMLIIGISWKKVTKNNVLSGYQKIDTKEHVLATTYQKQQVAGSTQQQTRTPTTLEQAMQGVSMVGRR